MARYEQAVRWIADMDDSDLGDPDEGGYIVSVCLVADVWSKERHEVYADVMTRRRIDTAAHQREVNAEYDEEDRMMDQQELYASSQSGE